MTGATLREVGECEGQALTGCCCHVERSSFWISAFLPSRGTIIEVIMAHTPIFCRLQCRIGAIE